MKKLVLNIILSLLLLNVLKVQGQDRKIPFQGTLYEEGSPFTGNIQMTFSMSHEGTKWSESHRVNVRSAVFFVVLGEKDTIPSVFFTLPDMKIEIGIGSESPLSIPLIPTPQAQYALNLTTATVTTDHFTTATPHKILATDSLGRVYWANNPTHSSVITFGQGSTSITNISGALQLTDFKTADSAAKEGMIRYNSDKHKTQIFQNGKWHIVSTQDSKFTTISQDNQSETMILGALQLSDYAGTTPKNGMLQYKNGKILIYRNGHWVNQNDRAINGLTQEDMDSLMIVRLGGELTRDTEIKTSNRKRLILSGNGGLSVQGNVFTSSNLVLGHQEMNQDGALGFSNGRFLGYSGGAWRAFSTLDTTQSTVILQDGNALSQTVKIGARDFQDLHLKVNNVTVMKFKTVGLVLGGTPSILGGFEGNTIVSNTQGAFIGGGGKEDAPNQVFGDFGVIVGGQNNQVSTTGFIGGGKHNKMDSTVLAGVIMGGVNNGIYHGGYSVIAGGYGNQVEAGHSFVAGNQAKVQKEHEGSFVWADNSGKPLMTTTPRQFMSRASGGFQFHTNPNNDDDKAVFINPGGKLGVGTSHSHAKLHVRSSPILESADENVALFESLEDHQGNTTKNVLTLNIHGNANQSNYITFQHRGKSIGSIEKVDTKLSASDLASHVRLKGTGADYAEWMYKLDLKETFHVADIVAVKDGKITKNTKHASCLKVISSSAIVLGNWKGSKLEKRMEQVAFLGQVPVKIRGAVCAGDFVIPSGKHDGTGQAVSPSKITASQYQQIVGVAWETSNLEGLKTVHVAVGQNTPEVKIAELMRASEYKTAEIQDLKVQNETLKANYLMLQQKVEKQQQQINQLLQMFQK